MLKLYLDSILIWLSRNSMFPLRPVNFRVIRFRLGYITKYEISFVKHASSNQIAAGWPSSAFYHFTRTVNFVSEPVFILLFSLYLLRFYYIINYFSFSPTQILPWRIFHLLNIMAFFVLSLNTRFHVAIFPIAVNLM